MPPSRTDSVRHQFAPAARDYAVSPIHAQGPDLQRMLATAAVAPHERVLDVGCGAGHTALTFAPHAREVVALDITAQMLDVVRQLASQRGLSNLGYQLGAAESLPFEDASFELVTSRYCAHHYADPTRATSEAARVLRGGGRYLLVDTVASEDPALDTFVNAIELLRDPSHVRNHSVSQWQQRFERAGLRFELVQLFPLRIEFDAWVERMNTKPDARAMIASMLRGAPAEIRAALELGADASCDFTQQTAIMIGRV